jgi:hypothetical protein
MSNELVTATSEPLAQKSNWQELAKSANTNPLLLVPKDCRAEITRLWMCNSHLLPSALALCSRVRSYLDECEVDAEDIRAIAVKLAQPEFAERHRFAGDLLADLAACVNRAAERNRSVRENQKRRSESDQFEALKIDLFKPPAE